jgi:hypothetical protein
MTTEYRKELKGQPRNFAGLETALEKSVINDIKKCLEVNSIVRAQKFIDETDKKRFIESKAKEMAISSQDLEIVMNTAFICVPYITSFHINKTKVDIGCNMTGGIAWYHVVMKEDKVNVVFLDKIESSGSGSSLLTQSVYNEKTKKWEEKRRDEKEVRREAVKAASQSVAGPVEKNTKNLAPFTINSKIANVQGGKIWFDMGKGEDVALDDKYHIIEYSLDRYGITDKKTVGFARISKVGDSSKGTQSIARVVKCGPEAVEGMTLTEHPRGSIDLKYGGRTKGFKIGRGRLVSGGVEYYNFNNEKEYLLYLISLGGGTNLAKKTHISQLYFNFDVLGSFTKPKNVALIGNFYPKNLFVIGADFTLQKKFYSGPIAFGIEAGGGLLDLISHTKFGADSISVGLTTANIDIVSVSWVASANLEYALGIDTNFGISVGNWFASNTNKWRLNLKRPGEKNSTQVNIENTDKPRLNLSGIEIKVYFTRSIL